MSAKGSPVTLYLQRRGISYSGPDIRWLESCPFGRERVGCMVALVRDIMTNEPKAIHRTAIDREGNKRSNLGANGRLTLGPISGGAIKLSDNSEVGVALGVGEGIETTLSIRNLPSLKSLPVWSLLSASQVANFPVLPGLETVWFAMDNDLAGCSSVERAASRLTEANVEALIIRPIAAGADLNDIWKGAHNA
ncbi:toprim domain-containing protein [Phyllobacterium sp. SB3]|uniref:toprim domain-containing protein n=1 Tax=Phyllobacterium sp. SB3 TaxID=3156073 RepID=UPI0032AF49DD